MKKIGRIKKGEKVLVQMLDETIQSVYDKYADACDEVKRAEEAVNESPKEIETWKNFVLRNMDKEELKVKLWRAIHEKHGLWNCNMGIRDNYALVQLRPPRNPFDEIRRIIEKM